MLREVDDMATGVLERAPSSPTQYASFAKKVQTIILQSSRHRPHEPVPECGACGVKRDGRRLPGGRARGGRTLAPPHLGRRGHADLGCKGERGGGSGGRGCGDVEYDVPSNSFDSPDLDILTFSLGLTPPAQLHPSGSGTSTFAPPSTRGRSYAPPPPGAVGCSLHAPSPLGTAGSSVPHMLISYVFSSDLDEHDDEQTDDVTLAQRLGFGHHVEMHMVLISLDQQRKVGLSIECMNNNDEMRYLWTIRPNIAKEGIHVLIEFEPIQSQTLRERHDTNIANILEHVMTITQMVSDEPSMLYPSVNEDDDDNDQSDEDYAISSESNDNDNPDDEEEDISTPVNLVISTIVNQWQNVGSGKQVDDLVKSDTIRLLDWNDAITDIQLGMRFVDKIQAISAVQKWSIQMGREYRVVKRHLGPPRLVFQDHRIRTVGEKLVGFGRGDGVGTDDDSDSINA
ncbi:hypothetical protein M9H77_03992 [Catharanthus roseus]|uniref:Uncharacterized protein n=1 Tax=Catharanthus roseus TaxID=4058 RepID=A0ACC0CD04_CATRO|nr:hypothetical protein M9H77_03992 [Catharanthus roseus]